MSSELVLCCVRAFWMVARWFCGRIVKLPATTGLAAVGDEGTTTGLRTAGEGPRDDTDPLE